MSNNKFFTACLFLFLFFALPLTAQETDILSDSDVALYTDVFALQHKSKFTDADKKIKQLSDKSLMGYVLFDRYFAKGYWTKKEEISSWLKSYSNLPIASDMYALGVQKKATLPKKKPAEVFGSGGGMCTSVVKQDPIDLIQGLPFSYLSGDKRKLAQKNMRQIARYILNGKTLNAKQLIENKETQKLLSKSDLGAAKTALAFSYFLDGMDEKSLEMSTSAIKTAGDSLALAYWTAGLAYWRLGDYVNAESHFKQAASHKRGKDILKAAAAFWTARSLLKQGKYGEIGEYLEQAAEHPRTFYGILAMRSMGQDLEHVWDSPQTPEDDISGEFSHPALERFYALKQINKNDWAQKELSKLYFEADAEGKGILQLISHKNGFDDELLTLSGVVNMSDRTVRYPAPNWTPMGGWKLDKSLVYAFVRQESCFNARAKSKVGALGLMQIMPQTGKELARRIKTIWDPSRAKEPEYNLALGQSYLEQLMCHPEIKNNLIFMAVGYNAGPGNLSKWKRKMKYNDDPLLFIESVPSKETRTFVERIIVNYWIYSALMGQSLSSLDDVISGHFPLYPQK